MKFNKGKHAVFSLWRKYSMHPYTMCVNELERSFAEKDLGLLIYTKLTVDHRCTLVTMKDNSLLG